MKTITLFIAIVMLTVIGINSSAQSGAKAAIQQKTESFKVWGKCDMCKERIETAVKAEGATTASWIEKTQILTVSYDPSKTSKDGLSKKLAAVGHDTEKYKAQDDVYAKLPGCCHYERSK
ncbi:MAG: ATPase [Bacteroidales bacterium]|nr:ATPase [Bacteroidales bacterium]